MGKRVLPTSTKGRDNIQYKAAGFETHMLYASALFNSFCSRMQFHEVISYSVLLPQIKLYASCQVDTETIIQTVKIKRE